NNDIKLIKIIPQPSTWGKIAPPLYDIDLPEIHQSYFSNLAPKVVSYGAGLIKLFQDEVKKEQQVKPMSWMESKINAAESVLAKLWNTTKDTAVIAYNTTKDVAIYAGGVVADTTATAYNASKTFIADEITTTITNAKAVKNIIVESFTGAAEVADAVKDSGINMTNEAVNSGLNLLTVSTDKTGKILGEAAVSAETRGLAADSNLPAQTGADLTEKEKKAVEIKKLNLPLAPSSKEGESNVKSEIAQDKFSNKKDEIIPPHGARAQNDALPPSLESANELVKVKYVIDGDTIELQDGRRVRYIGIDTAELNGSGSEDDECLAWVAREKNRILLEQSKDIKLVKDIGADKDKYGRLLRYVYGNTIFINETLAREGLAKSFICKSYMSDCPVMEDAIRINEIINAEKEAQSFKRGIYSNACEEYLENKKNNSALSDTFSLPSQIAIKNPENKNNNSKFIPLPGAISPALSLPDKQKETSDEEKDNDDNNKDNEDGQNPDQGLKDNEEPKDLLPPQTILKNIELIELNGNKFFTISWSGKDFGDIISGIAFYDIMYKINNGEWLNFETATTATSTIFNLNVSDDDGKEFCFQARAVDKAGNMEERAEHTPCPSQEGNSEQIKCSLVNLTYPNKPTFDYPKDGMILTTDAVTASGTVGLADIGKTLKIIAGENNYETSINENGIWRIDDILLSNGENIIYAYVVENDGDESEKISVAIEKINTSNEDYLNVVINEIAWMGTSADYNDEWIELYNNTGFPLDLNGWTLTASDGTPNIKLTGEIPSYGYYLMEHRKITDTNDDAISDITADKIYTGGLLNNDGEELLLKDGDGNLSDHINCSLKWFAGENGDKKTMERKDPTNSGDEEGNWDTNDGIIRNGKNRNGYNISGTPKSINSASATNNFLPNRMTA
ncbi:MAG: lamin tail domain-containing protein, partial [bacterium]